VEVEDGTVGIGETYLGVYMPELAIEAVKFFEPFLIGLDSTNIAKRWGDCQWISSYVGRTGPTVMALSAIECALWDVLGKRLGLPVHTLLGGAIHMRLPIYASGGVPTFTLDEVVANTEEVVADGYRGFKMRANPVAYQPEVEAERVAAVREVLGPDRLLAVDAVQNFNPQPWSVKQTLHLLDLLEPYDLAWAEEFLPPFDPAPYAELRARTNVHISGGEGITTSVVYGQWLRAGAFDIAQPDPTIVGGIGEARRVRTGASSQRARRHARVGERPDHDGELPRRLHPTELLHPRAARHAQSPGSRDLGGATRDRRRLPDAADGPGTRCLTHRRSQSRVPLSSRLGEPLRVTTVGPRCAYHLTEMFPPGIATDVVAQLHVAEIKGSSARTDRIAALVVAEQVTYVGNEKARQVAGRCRARASMVVLANSVPEPCLQAWQADARAQLERSRIRQRSFTDVPTRLKPEVDTS
jgi:L-alanine-DL-glutamate epimerase-like enolase superfamily enzyme